MLNTAASWAKTSNKDGDAIKEVVSEISVNERGDQNYDITSMDKGKEKTKNKLHLLSTLENVKEDLKIATNTTTTSGYLMAENQTAAKNTNRTK